MEELSDWMNQRMQQLSSSEETDYSRNGTVKSQIELK